MSKVPTGNGWDFLFIMKVLKTDLKYGNKQTRIVRNTQITYTRNLSRGCIVIIRQYTSRPLTININEDNESSGMI